MQLPKYHCEEHDNIGDDELTDSNAIPDLDSLEQMFPLMTQTEVQIRINRRIKAELPHVTGNAIGPYLQTGIAYFNKHGNLDGWNLKGRSVGAEFAQIDREAAAKRSAVLKAAGFSPRYATMAEVQHVMKIAHDACMADGNKPSASAMLRDAGVPAKTANKLASKRSIHSTKAWDQQEQHPSRVAMREQGVLSRRKERGAVSGSLAGTVAALYSLAEHTKDRQRLSAVEQAQARMESEIAALKAQLAQHEVRMDVTEAGIDAKATAILMRIEGKSLGDIASALGRKRATVQSWVRGVCGV